MQKHTENTDNSQNPAAEMTGETAGETAKAKVNARFTQTAMGYRLSKVHAQGTEFQRLIEAASFRGNELVIDAGCGAGHTAAHVAPHVDRVFAVDLSAAMLQQAAVVCAEQGLTNVEFVQGDVETLDATLHSRTHAPIDAIVSRFSAHHWPDPNRALQTFRRLLDGHGHVFLMDVVSQDDFVYDTHLQAIELLRDPSHIRDHSVSQWLQMFDQAGFVAQSLYEWNLAIDFDDWVARMQTPAHEIETIHKLFAGAPNEVQSRFNLNADSHNFTFSCALIQASPVA